MEGMGAYVEQECDRPDECEPSHGIALELRGFGQFLGLGSKVGKNPRSLPRTQKLQMQLSRGRGRRIPIDIVSMG